MTRRNPTDALVAAARANFLKPPSRDPKRLRAARAAVKGAESFEEGWEILQARGLLPMDMEAPYAVGVMGKKSGPREAALIASDPLGFMTAVALAFEANSRVEEILGLRGFAQPQDATGRTFNAGFGARKLIEKRLRDDRSPFDRRYPVAYELDRTSDPMLEAVRVASNAFNKGLFGMRLDEAKSYPERVAFMATKVDELRALGSKAWMLPGTTMRNVARAWAEFENPYDPILELLALGYASSVAPIMTWIYVPEPTR